MYLMAKWTKPDPVCISTTMSKAVLGDEDKDMFNYCCTCCSLSVLLLVVCLSQSFAVGCLSFIVVCCC